MVYRLSVQAMLSWLSDDDMNNTEYIFQKGHLLNIYINNFLQRRTFVKYCSN